MNMYNNAGFVNIVW